MIRKLVLGASALALTVGSLAVVGTPAGAKVTKPDGVIHCTTTNASISFSPGLTLAAQKKVLLGFQSTASGCTVTGGVGGGEGVTSIVLKGNNNKLKNASGTSLTGGPGAAPTVIKVIVDFMAGSTQVCENKAKLVATSVVGTNIQFTTTSAAAGGKPLGGKCFKKRTMTNTGQLDQSVAQLAGAITGPGGLTSLSINGPAATTVQ